jgi:hypothetical protein
VKQRLQLRRSPYRGVLDCIQRILKEEGVHAFYKSYPTTVVMNIPFTAMHFAAYEAGKKDCLLQFKSQKLPGLLPAHDQESLMAEHRI